MAGDMVDLRTIFLTCNPDKPSRTAEIFSVSCLSERDNFPMTKWIKGASFSVLREREFLAAIDLASDSGSLTIVPVLGLGIRPLGPRTLASLTSLAIWVGVAKRTSKSI